jgi:5-amino-6-(5-phospho-D-ribitylamino)uracil phosphatase
MLAEEMSSPLQFYVSDLDGTLLDAQGKLSARSRAGLKLLLENGMPITIASARGYRSIREVLGDLPFALPVIEYNGAFLTDYRTGQHLEINALEGNLAHALLDLIVASGQRPFVSTYNGAEDCVHYDELINPAMVWYEVRRRSAADPRLRRTPDLRQALSEAVVSLTVMDRSEKRIRFLEESIMREFGPLVRLYFYENAYFRGTYWLTIHSDRASKHLAVQKVHAGFPSLTQVVALGDNVNDIEMLRAADRAVAVENAVPELLALADLVIGHHTKDSVIQFLEAEAAS